MTADQTKKLHQVANALARSGVSQGLPGSADTIERAVETIRHLEIYNTGPNENIDRAKVLIHEVCVESDHNPFTNHWRNNEHS